MPVENHLPHPLPQAVRLIENGQSFHGLHIANPFTGQHAEISIVPSLNPENDGINIIEVIAPNGTSYWKTCGEKIIGNEPEGTIYQFESDNEKRTDWEIEQKNSFINPIWAGVK